MPKSEKETIISWQRFWVELWRLLEPFRPFFRAIAAITFGAAILDIIKPYILKLLIDGLNGFDAASIVFLLQLIALYLVTDEVRSLIRYFNDRKILRMLVEVEYALGVKAQEKLVSLSLGYHERENTGSKIVKIERGIDKISQFLNNFCWEVLPTLVELAFVFGALLWTDWRLGAFFIAFAALFMILTYWANKKMYPIRREIYRDYEVASGKMGQAIININAVQSFVQEKRELKDFAAIKATLREKEDKQWGWMMKVGLGRNSIVDIGRAVVLFFGVYLAFQGEISIGTLIFAFTLSETAYSSLHRLSRFYDKMEEGRAGVNRLLALFNAESEIVNPDLGFKPRTLQGEIKFEKVSFYYHGSRRAAVKDLSFKINSGCLTALVGPSGGGKTTVARLAYRHYDPQSGRVLLDDRDLREYDLHAFRRFLAVVPQEVEIFDLSVAENIAYARPSASRREIMAAARIANAAGFIDRLSQGYDTMVGERGIKLSGGQRQRLGIARAILANPRVLIFDEATSSLDSESEALIQDALGKISRDRTMIVIAHRLSTIRRADKIIVLENGRVAEEGSHLELARTGGGLYAKLLRLQAMGDID